MTTSTMTTAIIMATVGSGVFVAEDRELKQNKAKRVTREFNQKTLKCYSNSLESETHYFNANG
jgi:hypothetical protein